MRVLLRCDRLVTGRGRSNAYVIDGELALALDAEVVALAVGSYLLVPPGRAHSFWNPGERPATYVTVMAPGGFERYLAELAAGPPGAADARQAAALRRRLAKATTSRSSVRRR